MAEYTVTKCDICHKDYKPDPKIYRNLLRIHGQDCAIAHKMSNMDDPYLDICKDCCTAIQVTISKLGS
jgi:hypothetical protein